MRCTKRAVSSVLIGEEVKTGTTTTLNVIPCLTLVLAASSAGPFAGLAYAAGGGEPFARDAAEVFHDNAAFTLLEAERGSPVETGEVEPDLAKNRWTLYLTHLPFAGQKICSPSMEL